MSIPPDDGSPKPRAKVAYPFVAVPRDIAGPLLEGSFFDRCMWLEALRVTRGEWWQAGADWRETLCRAMCVNGTERPNVKRGMSRLHERGLIQVDGDRLQIVIKPGRIQARVRSNSDPSQVAAGSTPDPSLIAPRSDPGRTQVASRNEPSSRNHSHQVPQKEESDQLEELKKNSAREPARESEDRVFAHWVQVMGKPDAKLTAERRAPLEARRHEGYTDDQLCAAIDGCKLSPFHMGHNDRGVVFNDLATILKSGKAVESHLELLAQGGPKRRLGARKGAVPPDPQSDFPEGNEANADLDDVLPVGAG